MNWIPFRFEGMSFLNPPLVSCICVTHNRLALLQRSIQCFQHQTYHHKELIVAFSSDNIAAANLLVQLQDVSIKALVFPTGTPLTLGEKRNLAVESAGGSYFCVWDDDDWHSNNRLECQVQSLISTTFKSSALASIILYDHQTQDAYLSATRWGWEQTLLCQKSVMESAELRYTTAERGEDSSLLFNLRKQNLLNTIHHPDAYIYVYHGNNTFHRGHWEVNILPWANKLSPAQSGTIQDILESKLSHSESSEILRRVSW